MPPLRTPAAGPPPAAADFATGLGPRILAAAGALAFIVFLGLFVKYAWDRNLVGPMGRVLLGGAAGVLMLGAGVRLLRTRYRPLGQALSGAGLAGLYVSAFGAHGFYDLVSRNFAMALMVLITVCAVLLAARLDARLLAALAWIGGYLTPVLLSTGEDRGLALFLYLALLDAGALVLDHRKPWPETAPLAALGTVSSTAAGTRASTPSRTSTWPPSAWCCSPRCSRSGRPASRAPRGWRRWSCCPRGAHDPGGRRGPARAPNGHVDGGGPARVHPERSPGDHLRVPGPLRVRRAVPGVDGPSYGRTPSKSRPPG